MRMDKPRAADNLAFGFSGQLSSQRSTENAQASHGSNLRGSCQGSRGDAAGQGYFRIRAGARRRHLKRRRAHRQQTLSLIVAPDIYAVRSAI